MADVVLSERDFARVAETVRYVERLAKNTPPQAITRNVTDIPQRLEGLLDGDLFAPVDMFNETTATLSIYRWDPTITGFVDTGGDLTVTNRDPLFQALTGDYIEVGRINLEWRPLGGGNQGGYPDGPTTRVDTPAQVTYVVQSGDYYVLVDTDSTGGPLTVTLPGSTDGHTVVIHNTGSFFFRQVTVQTVNFTELAGGNVLLGPGQKQWAVYEFGTAKWWDAS